MEAKQNFDVEILSRRTIKPSSPTPQHLKTFHLSAWDHPIPSVHIATLFFFPSEDTNQNDDDITSRFHHSSTSIHRSLSQTLTHYFPLAGRLTDDESTIDCNDEGAFFVEARIQCPLVDFIAQPHPNLLNLITPSKDPNFPPNTVFAVQLTLFNCGGVALSVCLSHKIIDGVSSSLFFRSWTATARGEVVVAPKFLEHSISPHQDFLVKTPRVVGIPPGNFTTRRFVFSAKEIASLKAMIFKAMGEQVYLIDVDVVTALIMKSAIAAYTSLSSSEADPIILFHHVNMRRKLVPQLSQNTIGNVYCAVPVVLEPNEVEMDHLACKIRKGLTQFYADTTSNKIKDHGELLKSLKDKLLSMHKLMRRSLYKQDFGLGKPGWATYPVNSKNLIVLGDTREGGGTEAWISLDQEEMAKFEVDEGLLAFGTLNPNPLFPEKY